MALSVRRRDSRLAATLRIPGFRPLLTATVLMMVGESVLLLVFGIWVKSLTGSSSAAGLVMLCVAVPYALAPLTGWIVDRFRRRAFLRAVNLLSAVGLLPLFLVRDRGDVWIVFAVAALYGALSVLALASLNGLLKQMLSEELLVEANSLVQTFKEGLRLVGPLAGAGAYTAFGGAGVAGLGIAAFVGGAVAVSLVRLDEPPPERTGEPLTAEITAGVRHMVADPVLRRCLAAGAVGMLAIGMIESVSFAVVDEGLRRPPAFMGVFSAVQGVGAVLGGLASTRIIKAVGELAAVGLGLGAFGVGALLAAAPWTGVVLAGVAVSGAGLPVALVGIYLLIQRRSPAPLVGRVTTAALTLLSGPQTLSIAGGALLLPVVGYRTLLVTIMTGSLLAAVLLWTGRALTPPRSEEER